MYQSLGMTVSQLRRLVLLEGGFYALLMAAVLLPATLAFALWFMPGVIADLSWVAVYTFDVTPLWIILPVIAALALLTPAPLPVLDYQRHYSGAAGSCGIMKMRKRALLWEGAFFAMSQKCTFAVPEMRHWPAMIQTKRREDFSKERGGTAYGDHFAGQRSEEILRQR